MDVRFILVFISVGDLSKAVFKGIRMCEKECQLSKRCSAVRFDQIHLRCTLLLTGRPSFEGLVLLVKKDSKTDGLLHNCLDMLLLNKRGQTVCVPVKGTCNEEGETPPSKLLLHPYNSPFGQGYTMDLTTQLIERYLFPWANVMAVASYKSNLLLAIGHTIMSANPDSSKLISIKGSWNVQDIRTDEEMAFVYFITVLFVTEVHRLDPVYSRPARKIFSKTGILKMSFDLDRKAQRVYVSVSGSIFTLTYEGKSKDKFTPNMTPELITCDPTSGGVYFTSSTQLLRLIGRQVSVVKDMMTFGIHSVLSMCAYGRLVYMTVKHDDGCSYIFTVSFEKAKMVLVSSDGNTEYRLALT